MRSIYCRFTPSLDCTLFCVIGYSEDQVKANLGEIPDERTMSQEGVGPVSETVTERISGSVADIGETDAATTAVTAITITTIAIIIRIFITLEHCLQDSLFSLNIICVAISFYSFQSTFVSALIRLFHFLLLFQLFFI